MSPLKQSGLTTSKSVIRCEWEGLQNFYRHLLLEDGSAFVVQRQVREKQSKSGGYSSLVTRFPIRYFKKFHCNKLLQTCRLLHTVSLEEIYLIQNVKKPLVQQEEKTQAGDVNSSKKKKKKQVVSVGGESDRNVARRSQENHSLKSTN